MHHQKRISKALDYIGCAALAISAVFLGLVLVHVGAAASHLEVFLVTLKIAVYSFLLARSLDLVGVLRASPARQQRARVRAEDRILEQGLEQGIPDGDYGAPDDDIRHAA